MAVYERGKGGFISYYSSIFNWLKNETDFDRYLGTRNQPILLTETSGLANLQKRWLDAGLSFEPLSWFPNATRWPQEASLGVKLPGYDEQLFYAMNPSSLLPAIALKAMSNDLILDACAAPGGKTLAICTLEDTCKIVANDRSPNRSNQMSLLFKKMSKSNITVMRNNAATIYKKYPDTFDRILLDAPCSSEKHVWQNPIELNRWSYKRIKRLAQEQYALLSGLLLALKPGGRMVYSTCALTPEENEHVIDRFLREKGDGVRLINCNWSELPGEASMSGEYSYDSQWVRRIYTNNFEGLDPMFVAVFEKV